MANDRIYIKCRHCKATFLFAKYYPSNYGLWYPKEFEEWVDQHMGCGEHGISLNGDRCFDLCAQSSDDFKAFCEGD